MGDSQLSAFSPKENYNFKMFSSFQSYKRRILKMKCSLEMLNSFKTELSKFHYSKKEKKIQHFMDSTMSTLPY